MTKPIDLLDVYAYYDYAPVFLANYSLVPRVADYESFIDSVFNYIIEYHGIKPRTFELADSLKHSVHQVMDGGVGDKSGRCSLRYDHRTVSLNGFECTYYENGIRNATHVHSAYTPGGKVFCTEPEIAAALYINGVVYGPEKATILNGIKDWLPTATSDDWALDLIPYTDTDQYNKPFDGGGIVSVNSDLNPSLCVIFLYDQERVTVYDDDDDDDVDDERSRSLHYTYSSDNSDLNFDRSLGRHYHSRNNTLWPEPNDCLSNTSGYIDTAAAASTSALSSSSSSSTLLIDRALKLHCAHFECYTTANIDNKSKIMVKSRRRRSKSPANRRRRRSGSRTATTKKKTTDNRRRSRSPSMGKRGRSASRERMRSRSKSR